MTLDDAIEQLRDLLPPNEVLVVTQLGTTKRKFYIDRVSLDYTNEEAQHQMIILGKQLAGRLDKYYKPIGDLPQ